MREFDFREPHSRFCQELFTSLTRSDQRRWAEAYVWGLASVPGRKSIRRISDHVLGWRADQCLQQFVNQSPWQWEPVRRALARFVVDTAPPAAWIVEEAVFPKNGASSVGVAKQYVPSAGRTLNCQLGLAVVLAGEETTVPVNWRLAMPRCWDDDPARRDRTGVPQKERHQQRSQVVLDAVDEMIGWELTPAPVVVDASHDPDVEVLLEGLEERGLRYLVRVPEDLPVAGGPRVLTAGELAVLSARRVSWRDHTDRRLTSSQFIAAAVPGAVPLPRIVPGVAYRRMRRVVAEWPSGRGTPASVWLTNLGVTRLPELARLVDARRRAARDLTAMRDEVGLRHFEGRSFRGWHHHVTLASVAHAYTRLSDTADQPIYA